MGRCGSGKRAGGARSLPHCPPPRHQLSWVCHALHMASAWVKQSPRPPHWSGAAQHSYHRRGVSSWALEERSRRTQGLSPGVWCIPVSLPAATRRDPLAQLSRLPVALPRIGKPLSLRLWGRDSLARMTGALSLCRALPSQAELVYLGLKNSASLRDNSETLTPRQRSLDTCQVAAGLGVPWEFAEWPQTQQWQRV